MWLRPRRLVPVVTALIAAVRGDAIQDILTLTPPCALGCFLNAMTEARCSLASVQVLSDCLCVNTPLLMSSSKCMQQSCSWSDVLVARNITVFTLCRRYPKEDRSAEARNVAIVGLAITVPVLFLRCLSRLYSSGKLWLDDYTSVGAAGFLIALLGVQLQSSKLGFGLHFWDVDEASGLQLSKLFWIGQLLYIMVQKLAKISLLILYMRLFQSRWCQIVVKGGICFLVLRGVLFFFLILFQCIPVASIFDRTIPGKCLNFTAIVYAAGVLGILEDFVLLAIPIPDLWKLRLNRRKKAALALMFGTGAVGTVTSIVRMTYLFSLGDIYDQSYDNIEPIKWSVIEEICIVICGSLPPCRAILSAAMPRMSSTAKGRPDFISSTVRSCNFGSVKAVRYNPVATIGGTGEAGRRKFSLYRLTGDPEELGIGLDRQRRATLPKGPARDVFPGERGAVAEDENASLNAPATYRTSTEARLGDPDMFRLQIHSPSEVVEKRPRHISSYLARASCVPTLPADLAQPPHLGETAEEAGHEHRGRHLSDPVSGTLSMRQRSRRKRSVFLRPESLEPVPDSPTIPRPVTELMSQGYESSDTPPPPMHQRPQTELLSSASSGSTPTSRPSRPGIAYLAAGPSLEGPPPMPRRPHTGSLLHGCGAPYRPPRPPPTLFTAVRDPEAPAPMSRRPRIEFISPSSDPPHRPPRPQSMLVTAVPGTETPPPPFDLFPHRRPHNVAAPTPPSPVHIAHLLSPVLRPDADSPPLPGSPPPRYSERPNPEARGR